MRFTENIDKGWLFRKSETTFETINLPHTWNALDGQSGEEEYHRGACYYQKKMIFPPHDGKIYIEFQAVNHKATVTLNGNLLGIHEGGFSTFRFDLTLFICQGENLLEVVADNSEELDIYPQHADFTFFGGIYRSVSLIFVKNTHFDLDYFGSSGIYITPEVTGSGADIQIDYYANGDCTEVTASFEVLDRDGKIVANLEQGDISHGTGRIPLSDVNLWEGTKNPYLYRLKSTLYQEEKEIDQVIIPFGVRSFSVDSQKGFILNQKYLPLRGVSKHQDRQDKGWATSKDDLIEDIKLIQEIGANTIRLAHYQHPQDFYDLCDENGMIVWAEIPFITTFLQEAVGNTLSQMKELVVQNYNHPSICFWGISNEITIGDEIPEMVENQKQLQALIKKLDSKRYTTIANMTFVEMDSQQNELADLVAYNHYFGWYQGTMEEQEQWLDDFHEKYPDKPLCLSEYGVEAVLQYHTDTPRCKDYSEEYQCVFHQHMAEIFQERSYLWATYVWNMFDFAANERDEGGVKGRNNKGLVTFDRQTKKDSFYVYKAFWNNSTPFVHLVGRRYVDRPYDTVDITVYSNENKVTLWVNGFEIATQKGNKVFTFPQVSLNIGENLLEAKTDSSHDTMTLNRLATANPDYILTTLEQENASVKNWFEEKEDFPQELTFHSDYFSVKDKLKSVIAKPEGLALFEELLISAGLTPNPKKMKMVYQVKIENIIKMAGSSLPDNSIYSINNKLQQIKR